MTTPNPFAKALNTASAAATPGPENPEAVAARELLESLQQGQAVPDPTTEVSSKVVGAENASALLAAVHAGIQGTDATLPISARRAATVRLVDGMAKPGYYSTTKPKVAGVMAAQLGGRYYFPLDAQEEVLAAMPALVAAEIYMLVGTGE